MESSGKSLLSPKASQPMKNVSDSGPWARCRHLCPVASHQNIEFVGETWRRAWYTLK